MLYLSIKALHIIFMVTWFAGLFYRPRIFVYHAANKSPDTNETFKVMERKLMIMMNIGAALTIIFGITLIVLNPSLLKMGWLHFKLLLVFFLLIYHYFCYHYVLVFRHDKNTRDHKFYRYFNEFPSIILIMVVFLVVLKGIPFINFWN